MDPIIPIALSLLALVAGMFLLAKTRAEMLGKFFKFTSGLIVTLGFVCLVCGFVHAFHGMCCKNHHGHDRMEKRVMIMRGGHDMPPCCDMASGKCSMKGHAGVSAGCCAEPGCCADMDMKGGQCKADGKGAACCANDSKHESTAAKATTTKTTTKK